MLGSTCEVSGLAASWNRAVKARSIRCRGVRLGQSSSRGSSAQTICVWVQTFPSECHPPSCSQSAIARHHGWSLAHAMISSRDAWDNSFHVMTKCRLPL